MNLLDDDNNYDDVCLVILKICLSQNGLMHEQTTYIFTAHSMKLSSVLNKLVFFDEIKLHLIQNRNLFLLLNRNLFFLNQANRAQKKKIYIYLSSRIGIECFSLFDICVFFCLMIIIIFTWRILFFSL